MSEHSHQFVEQYDGFLGFGMDRETDENTIKVYLQKFSDDALIKHLIPKMSDGDLGRIFDLISDLLRKYLTENEYHNLFLKEAHS